MCEYHHGGLGCALCYGCGKLLWGAVYFSSRLSMMGPPVPEIIEIRQPVMKKIGDCAIMSPVESSPF
jgi:hypothetical protein